jgi:hypothetical protein
MSPRSKRKGGALKKRPRFGRLPERGVTDKRLWRTRHGMHARVLYACSIHADAAGLFCISQETVAGLVGLRHGANAYSYMRDLEDWGYLRRVKTLPHPDRKFIKDAAKAMGRTDIKPPYLSDLIVRQVIIRPGEDEADNAAKIPASRRIDEDHPIELPEAAPARKPSPAKPTYSQRPVIAEKTDRAKPAAESVASSDFDIL